MPATIPGTPPCCSQRGRRIGLASCSWTGAVLSRALITSTARGQQWRRLLFVPGRHHLKKRKALCQSIFDADIRSISALDCGKECRERDQQATSTRRSTRAREVGEMISLMGEQEVWKTLRVRMSVEGEKDSVVRDVEVVGLFNSDTA